MRLADLNPKLEGSLERGVITFDCPLGHAHKIRVPIHAAPFGEVDGVRYWQASGAFPDALTLHPSVENGPSCWHGNITNGAIQ